MARYSEDKVRPPLTGPADSRICSICFRGQDADCDASMVSLSGDVSLSRRLLALALTVDNGTAFPFPRPITSEVPTVAEQGYPGFDSSQWFGLLAPPKTPAPV